MDPGFERVYLTEIVLQSEYAIVSALRVNALLQEHVAAALVFRELYAFVSHAGGVSRVLWPPRIRDSAGASVAQARGCHLRSVLNVADDHPLRSRTLRDHLEHFDERLDRWAQETTHAAVVDLHIGPTSVIGGDGISKGDFLRAFDPRRKVFTHRGAEFDIQELATATEGIRAAAVERLAELQTSKFDGE